MATTALIDHAAPAGPPDLFRQIGHDERVHTLDSLASLRAPRPHQAHEAGEAS